MRKPYLRPCITKVEGPNDVDEPQFVEEEEVPEVLQPKQKEEVKEPILPPQELAEKEGVGMPCFFDSANIECVTVALLQSGLIYQSEKKPNIGVLLRSVPSCNGGSWTSDYRLPLFLLVYMPIGLRLLTTTTPR